MMTQEEARRVIYSSKFIENQHVYGIARRNTARAMIEVENNMKNHQFINSEVKRRYGGGEQPPKTFSGGVSSLPATPSAGANVYGFTFQSRAFNQPNGGAYLVPKTGRKFGQMYPQNR